MTRDEIIQAAKDRLAEIEAQKGALDKEAAGLRAMLGEQTLGRAVPLAPQFDPSYQWPIDSAPSIPQYEHVMRLGPIGAGASLHMMAGSVCVGGDGRRMM